MSFIYNYIIYTKKLLYIYIYIMYNNYVEEHYRNTKSKALTVKKAKSPTVIKTKDNKKKSRKKRIIKYW